jgi:hypothetical protein
MFSRGGRVLWWILAWQRPASGGQLAALFALLGLLAIGALALAWPWLTIEAPRIVAAGLAVVQEMLVSWLRQLQAALLEWLRQLPGGQTRAG